MNLVRVDITKHSQVRVVDVQIGVGAIERHTFYYEGRVFLTKWDSICKNWIYSVGSPPLEFPRQVFPPLGSPRQVFPPLGSPPLGSPRRGSLHLDVPATRGSWGLSVFAGGRGGLACTPSIRRGQVCLLNTL